MGSRSMKDVGGAVLAGSTPPFRGRKRAAIDVDVGPERRSPRYHETCLALESVEESSAAVSKPRGVCRPSARHEVVAEKALIVPFGVAGMVFLDLVTGLALAILYPVQSAELEVERQFARQRAVLDVRLDVGPARGALSKRFHDSIRNPLHLLVKVFDYEVVEILVE